MNRGRRRGRVPAGGWPAAGRERGGATVWVLSAGLLTVLIAVAFAAGGAAIVARHRAQAAADLAALAGAGDAVAGPEAACARAEQVAAANGGNLTACLLDGFDLVVTVEVVPANVAAWAGTARASARAGPADDLTEVPGALGLGLGLWTVQDPSPGGTAGTTGAPTTSPVGSTVDSWIGWRPHGCGPAPSSRSRKPVQRCPPKALLHLPSRSLSSVRKCPSRAPFHRKQRSWIGGTRRRAECTALVDQAAWALTDRRWP